MSALDPAPFADLLAGLHLQAVAGETVLVRSTSLAAPLLLELQRSRIARWSSSSSGAASEVERTRTVSPACTSRQ